MNSIINMCCNKQLIDWLPVPLLHKWRAVADNVMYEMKQSVSIKNIANFVRKQEQEVNNLIVGITMKEKTTSQKLFFISAETKPVQNCGKSCLMCSELH